MVPGWLGSADELERGIGVDEIQCHRGHKYQTPVYQIDEGRKQLLWIDPDRTAKTLLRFFRFLGKDRSRALQFVCSDIWKAYLKVIAKKAPQAFHILNWFRAEGRLSSGVVEGFNNKLKMITRKSYGFRTQEAYENALYHSFGALPEPNFTHRFF